MKHYSLLLLLFLLIFSCQQETNNTEQNNSLSESSPSNQISNEGREVSQESPQEHTVDEALVKECTEYWKEIERLNSLSTDYFNKEFLPRALANKALPEQNRKFLLALKAYLNQSKEEYYSTLVTDQVLFPIFRLKNNELGIFAFPKYDTENPEHADISQEHKALKNIKLTAYTDKGFQDKVVFYPELADSLFKNRPVPVYAFTSQKKANTQITNFGYFNGECLQYYNYLLDNRPFSSTDKVLFGSKYDLDLQYKGSSLIDSQLKSQYKKKCQDCPNSSELEKTFATLKGVEGLYFTFADTFPLNDQLDTPLRGLVMKMNDKLVHLWYAEVDLVGCSCI